MNRSRHGGGSLRTYVRAHWRGEQSLARSFWLNLVLLRALVFVLQRVIDDALGAHHTVPGWLIVACIVLVHGPLFVWQVVGALRAAEHELVDSGAQASAWGVQLSVVVLGFLTFAYINEGWQTSRPVAQEQRFDLRMEAERRARYTLHVDLDARRIVLDGELTLGVTRRLEGLLASDPAVDAVWLHSAGGNVHAARGLARVMREHTLASHVERLCASACTIAFLAGTSRTIAPDARLGFHRYRLQDGRGALSNDPAEAQRQDEAAFVRAGVDPAFAARLFDAPADRMWWPTQDELLGNGVVDRVVTGSAID